jgi:hypothetical protein
MSAGDDLLALGIEPVKSHKAATLGEAGYARRERDFYPTEPWVTRTLIRYIDFHLWHLVDIDNPHDDRRIAETIWEPACGDGRMAEVLAAAGYRVVASDIADHGYGARGMDFLDPSAWRGADQLDPTIPVPRCAAIITNPPFDRAREFVVRALELTRAVKGKVAIVQRHEFDAPRGNHALFQLTGGVKLILHKRPRWSEEDKASPRFPYAWYVWDWAQDGAWRILFCKDPDTIADSESLL